MTSAHLLRGLYVITNGPNPAPRVESALSGGARLVQYRDKTEDRARQRREALALQALCRDFSVPLIINDDLLLAAELCTAGVHLGRDDPPLAEARKMLGPEAIIGVSCYNRLERAMAAAQGGASYVAFGRFFPSGTKPLAVQAHPDVLREARRTLGLPLVAIGGISPENGGALIEAGADMLAVVGGVFGQADVRGAARAFTSLFEKGGVTP